MSTIEALPGHSFDAGGQEPPAGVGIVAPVGDNEPRRPVLRCLTDYKAEPVEWLWRDRVPAGELSLLVGDGGLGKSTFAAYLAAEVTRGRARGLTGTRRVVVVLGEDDPARVLTTRYRAADADMNLVSVLAVDHGNGDEALSLPDDLRLVGDAIEAHRPDLLIVDPLGAHLGGQVDAHRDGGKGGIRAVLNPLSRLAQAHGTTVLVALHLNKGTGPASSRIAGSAGFRNAARNVLVLAAHPDAREDGNDNGQRCLGHDKSNYGPLQLTLEATVTEVHATDADGHALVRKDGEFATTSVLTIGAESDIDYEQALRSASSNGDGDGRGDAMAEACEFLRVELIGGPVSVKSLRSMASDAGHSWRTIERAFTSLGVESRKDGSTWVRALPGMSANSATSPNGGGVGGVEDDHDEKPVSTGDSSNIKSANAANSAMSANSATSDRLADLADIDDERRW